MRINRRQLEIWINALRSGEFKQGYNQLQKGDTYCCLGVACKVLIPEHKLEIDEDGDMYGIMPGIQSYCPKWLDEIAEDFTNKTGRELPNLNDAAGLTFDEIADLLEAVYILKVL